MENLYDKEFLKDTIYVLKAVVKDLNEWSVYNGDKGLDEIHDLIEAMNKVKEKVLWTQNES